MGLADTIQKATQTAFKAIGNIPVTCTYSSKGATVYNPTTGAMTSTDIDYTGLSIVLEDFNPREVTDAGGAILTTDKKLSIPKANLTAIPKLSDYVTDSDGIVWYIKDILTDPARALWLFQARRAA